MNHKQFALVLDETPHHHQFRRPPGLRPESPPLSCSSFGLGRTNPSQYPSPAEEL